MTLLMFKGLSEAAIYNMQSLLSEVCTDDIFVAKPRPLYVVGITRTLRRRHCIPSTLRLENIGIPVMSSHRYLDVLAIPTCTIGL